MHANAKPPNPSTHSQRGNGIWGSLNWTYDLVGNRTSETLTGSTANTFNYPATSNQLASVTQGAITLRGFSYDGAGNVTADNRGGTTYNYRYNQRGRLDELAIDATVTADYVYDGLERMAVRTTQNMSPAGTTHYLYDLKGHLLVEADSTGQTLREYVWIDDLPLAVVADVNTASPNLYYVHADQVNRPLKMTDGSEAVVWNATYRPFGEIVSITGSASNNLRFPGQYFLIEDGLHYNWYRHYDPTLGRYLQADPLGFISGPNLFEYALSIPQMAADPTGRFAPIIVGIGIVAAYALTPSTANAPGPNDQTTPVDDLAPFENAATVAACLAPHYWWSTRSMGGGIRLWRNGPGVDWHRFKLNGETVNRPHWEPGPPTRHHWPWN